MTIYLDSIFVIASLDENEIKEAEDIYHSSIKHFENGITIPKSNFKTEFLRAKTKVEFLKSLEYILFLVLEKDFAPIIHLELHGDINKQGLITESKELIRWKEVYPYFQKINLKIKNQLIITTGVCFSTYILTEIDYKSNSPFLALIGTEHSVSPFQISDFYNKFYSILLFESNLTKAFALTLENDVFKMHGPENLIKHLVLVELKEYSNYIREIPAKVNFVAIDKRLNLSQSDKKKFEIKLYHDQKGIFLQHLFEIWNTFLMIDIYPESKSRYLSLNYIIKKTISEDNQLTEFYKTDLINHLNNKFNNIDT